MCRHATCAICSRPPVPAATIAYAYGRAYKKRPPPCVGKKKQGALLASISQTRDSPRVSVRRLLVHTIKRVLVLLHGSAVPWLTFAGLARGSRVKKHSLRQWHLQQSRGRLHVLHQYVPTGPIASQRDRGCAACMPSLPVCVRPFTVRSRAKLPTRLHPSDCAAGFFSPGGVSSCTGTPLAAPAVEGTRRAG